MIIIVKMLLQIAVCLDLLSQAQRYYTISSAPEYKTVIKLLKNAEY